MHKIKSRLKWILLLLFAILLFGEISLRFIWGFCDAPLYIASNNFEYIAAPKQTGKRFGNKYHFNAYSQRNNKPDPSKTKILGLGDSVLFGGVQSDQDSIATSIFNQTLTNFQMLNISSGSWGPDNCAAYLKEYGTFNAKAMFLLVSSHDAYDVMDFKPVVGNHSSYPEHQYNLAWWELLNRYIKPRVSNIFSKQDKKLDPDEIAAQGIQKKGLKFNPGFQELKILSDSLHIPLTVYLHAEKAELHNQEYNSQGKEIIKWTTENNVNLIKELDYDFKDLDYRDIIHLNNKGQKKLAEIIIENFKKDI
ncbi:hypothetical protein [Maribacter sp.]|uniref:hypothetical protein n=1 Tax=Maribacter sp. TaxID=1897614 RepID=UPI0025B9F5C9|nr:hypothetical protein [Maribacter sp.]